MASPRRALILVPVVAVIAAAVVVVRVVSRHSQPSARCLASAGAVVYTLDPEQATNATTIAAVGKKLGMPDHAVTVALAAALQESKLHNLSHGDLDSLGLFQQRPSQGWGTPAEVMTPHYAAAAFYQHLALISGWEALPVTEAAQQVQLSAAPSAYAQWEAEARVVAQALTGEVPAGLTCAFRPAAAGTPDPGLATAMRQELGQPAIDVPVSAARGWVVASWLVGHASAYRVGSVTFSGQRWTPTSGGWKPGATADSVVRIDTPA